VVSLIRNASRLRSSLLACRGGPLLEVVDCDGGDALGLENESSASVSVRRKINTSFDRSVCLSGMRGEKIVIGNSFGRDRSRPSI